MIAFVLTVLGAALLCLSMERHWTQVLRGTGYSRPAALALRAAAYLVLAGAVAAASDGRGVGAGLALVFALFSAAVLGIAMSLAYWLPPPQRASRHRR